MRPRQIENRRNISHEMIVRNDIIEREFIEQLARESVFEVEGK
jgi:hypothetical protein